jgi:hypothetical protein
MYTLFRWRKNVVSTTVVKSIPSLGNTVTLGYASCGNSSPLGGKAALNSLGVEIKGKIKGALLFFDNNERNQPPGRIRQSGVVWLT